MCRKLQLDKNAQDAANPRRKRSANKNVPEELAQHTEAIALLGRKYGTLIEPWVDVSFFQEPRPDIDPKSEDRYLSPESRKHGRIAELHDFIPPKYHELMNNHSYFASTVSNPNNCMMLASPSLI
jgi:hypothetical protein